MQDRKLGPEVAGQLLRSMGRPMEGFCFSLSPLGWEAGFECRLGSCLSDRPKWVMLLRLALGQVS